MDYHNNQQNDSNWHKNIDPEHAPSLRAFLIAIIFFVFLFLCITSISKLMPNRNTVLHRTTLEIVNNSDYDSVLVWLTLGADTNYITDVNGIFGINQRGLKGSFWLKKDSVYTYKYSDKPISGNICFDTIPLNCPSGSYTRGTNLFEFTLNNYGIVKDGQETIDISNVAGVNTLGEFKMTGGGKWYAGNDNVDSFSNSYMYRNVGRYGVFPYMCDDCTESSNPPNCNSKYPKSKPQNNSICVVSRSSKQAGGTVLIRYLGQAD